MSVAAATEVAGVSSGRARIAHAYCHCTTIKQGAVALCGYVKENPTTQPAPGDAEKCVVCVDLYWTPCRKCGKWPA